MRIYGSEIDNGSVNALLMIEPSEIGEYSRTDMSALNEAIQGAVFAYTRALELPELILVRVIDLEIQDDGSVMVNIEGAIKPEVKLGKYRGLSVAADAENAEAEAVSAAAENMSAEIPEVMVQRRLDSMADAEKAGILSDIASNYLADIKEIYTRVCRKAALNLTEDTLWDEAVSISRDHTDSGEAEPTMERLSELIRQKLSLHGAIPEDFAKHLENAIRARVEQRRSMLPEILAGQVFEAKLKAENSSELLWKRSRHAEALKLVRRELLLDAVADTEGIKISDEQLKGELENMERQFELTGEEILSHISREAVTARLRRRIAAGLIADSAVRE